MKNMDVKKPSEQFLQGSVLQRRWLNVELTQYKLFSFKNAPLFYLK